MKTGHWTPEEVDYLKSHYVEQGSTEIGKALDRNPRSVSCMAYYYGLHRGWGDKPRYRAFGVNENFFKSWTPEMAYVLGVIVTDGNIGEREFNVVSNDTELLEKVRGVMQSQHRITKLTGQNTYRLRIGSKSMVKDLIALGITEHKSKTVRLPNIADALFFSFLRGYLDGDGMLKYEAGKTFLLKLSTGSPYILDEISDAITRLIGIERHNPAARSQLRGNTTTAWYELTYCGHCASKICEAMYDHAGDLCLSRKYQAFVSYQNRPKTLGGRNNGNASKYYY